MAMKINRPDERMVSQIHQGAPVRPTSVSAPPDAEGAFKGEQVSVSEQARKIAAVHRLLVEQPEIREQRIAELRAAIISGEYQMDLAKLAAALLKARVLE